jgi:hypothetical protein
MAFYNWMYAKADPSIHPDLDLDILLSLFFQNFSNHRIPGVLVGHETIPEASLD